MKALIKKGERSLTKALVRGKLNDSMIKSGMRFSAIIGGTKLQGRVWIDKVRKKIWFCQNFKCGDVAPNRLGYRNSWVANYAYSFTENAIKELKIFPIGAFKVPPPELRIGTYLVNFNKGSITVGCTKVDNDLVKKIAARLKN